MSKAVLFGGGLIYVRVISARCNDNRGEKEGREKIKLNYLITKFPMTHNKIIQPSSYKHAHTYTNKSGVENDVAFQQNSVLSLFHSDCVKSNIHSNYLFRFRDITKMQTVDPNFNLRLYNLYWTATSLLFNRGNVMRTTFLMQKFKLLVTLEMSINIIKYDGVPCICTSGSLCVCVCIFSFWSHCFLLLVFFLLAMCIAHNLNLNFCGVTDKKGICYYSTEWHRAITCVHGARSIWCSIYTRIIQTLRQYGTLNSLPCTQPHIHACCKFHSYRL